MHNAASISAIMHLVEATNLRLINYCIKIDQLYLNKNLTYVKKNLKALKPTCAILLYPWKRHFLALFPAWWS